MTRYRHTQIGWLIIVVMGGSVALFATLLDRSGPSLILLAAFAITLAALLVFSTLTVEITDESFRFHFSFGLFAREIALDSIARCAAVETSVLEGWGLRFTARGRLYNVSGTRAVELWLHGGTRLRVGSDEPMKVCAALDPLLRPLVTAVNPSM